MLEYLNKITKNDLLLGDYLYNLCIQQYTRITLITIKYNIII